MSVMTRRELVVAGGTVALFACQPRRPVEDAEAPEPQPRPPFTSADVGVLLMLADILLPATDLPGGRDVDGIGELLRSPARVVSETRYGLSRLQSHATNRYRRLFNQVERDQQRVLLFGAADVPETDETLRRSTYSNLLLTYRIAVYQAFYRDERVWRALGYSRPNCGA